VGGKKEEHDAVALEREKRARGRLPRRRRKRGVLFNPERGEKGKWEGLIIVVPLWEEWQLEGRGEGRANFCCWGKKRKTKKSRPRRTGRAESGDLTA